MGIVPYPIKTMPIQCESPRVSTRGIITGQALACRLLRADRLQSVGSRPWCYAWVIKNGPTPNLGAEP
jgi:hypothetical protein